MNKNKGFTLIELMVAVAIFAIISVIAYRTVSSLVTTKQVVLKTQQKWGTIANSIDKINTGWVKAIPLVVRDRNGLILPAFIGRDGLNGPYDAQLEFTTAGYIGDAVYGASPPHRIGFRYYEHNLYLVTWPVLNRVQGTKPEINLLLKNIDTFKATFMTPYFEWRTTWPYDEKSFVALPRGIKVDIKMRSGEEIIRQWALR